MSEEYKIKSIFNFSIEELSTLNTLLVFDTINNKNGMISSVIVNNYFNNIYIEFEIFMNVYQSYNKICLRDFVNGNYKFLLIKGSDSINNYEIEKIKKIFGEHFREDMITYIEESERQQLLKEDNEEAIQNMIDNCNNMLKYHSDEYFDIKNITNFKHIFSQMNSNFEDIKRHLEYSEDNLSEEFIENKKNREKLDKINEYFDCKTENEKYCYLSNNLSDRYRKDVFEEIQRDIQKILGEENDSKEDMV